MQSKKQTKKATNILSDGRADKRCIKEFSLFNRPFYPHDSSYANCDECRDEEYCYILSQVKVARVESKE